ncbi:MAG TPA: hypothetical protein DCR21_01285 [Succinivibrionaceae bacterium]|nr:hypothetical protein [Succinivibrio sp.]HAR79439.1 hypothetical protein [Succinivibrionaceae bacterium]
MSEASNERLLKLLKDIDRQEPYNDLLKAIKATHDNYKSIESLVEEIREDGSNTIARLIKGPVDYDEIVRDVAIKVGVPKDQISPVSEEENELKCLCLVLEKNLDSMQVADREKAVAEIDKIIGGKYHNYGSLSTLSISFTLMQIIKTIGIAQFKPLLAKIISKFVVVNTAKTAGSLAGSRVLGFAIPFLNIALGVWLAIDLAGPAYRKTVPTVLQVAFLRNLYKETEEAYKNATDVEAEDPDPAF